MCVSGNRTESSFDLFRSQSSKVAEIRVNFVSPSIRNELKRRQLVSGQGEIRSNRSSVVQYNKVEQCIGLADGDP